MITPLKERPDIEFRRRADGLWVLYALTPRGKALACERGVLALQGGGCLVDDETAQDIVVCGMDRGMGIAV